MRIRVILIFATLVLLPVMGMGWFGLRLVLNESKMARHQLRELLDTQLTAMDEQLHLLMQDRERVLLSMTTGLELEADVLRGVVADEPAVRHAFLMEADGSLRFPTRASATANERAFLERTSHIWRSGELAYEPEYVETDPKSQAAAPKKGMLRQYQVRSFDNSVANQGYEVNAEAMQQKLQQSYVSPAQQQAEVAPTLNVDSNWSARALDAEGSTASGWYTWYWGDGMQVIFWKRLPDTRILGFELDGERLLSDVAAALAPAYGAVSSPRTSSWCQRAFPKIVLIDGRGERLREWGREGESWDGLALWTQRVLQPPLQSWRLAAYLPPQAGNSLQVGVMLNIAALLLIFVVVVLGLGAWLYQETGREMRLASQRVSFVNNVSHELKTPLTNIRMYAELLAETVDEEDARSRKYLGTVVRESQRLSRLIGNVLTFAGNQHGGQTLKAQAVVPDEVLQATVEQFRPALAAAGLEIGFQAGASRAMRLDRDVLEQVVVNLLSNVEKYAASGKRVELRSSQDGAELRVVVRDWGPGIGPKERGRIFQPFYRVSNKMNDGVAGTGIGLSITRELARRHGGDLTVANPEQGAEFCLQITEVKS